MNLETLKIKYNESEKTVERITTELDRATNERDVLKLEVERRTSEKNIE